MPPESLLDAEQQQSLLYSSDLELGETTKQIFEAVERVQPEPGGARQPVRDPAAGAEFAALPAPDPGDQALLRAVNATVLLLDDLTADAADKTVHSVAHGVIRLEELAPDYGAERRRLRVIKYRGAAVSRRLSRLHHHDRRRQRLSAPGGGRASQRFHAQQGVERHRRARRSCWAAASRRGSSTLILGPAGTGKSLVTIAFVAAAIERGEKAALFVFDEELGLLFDRA